MAYALISSVAATPGAAGGTTSPITTTGASLLLISAHWFQQAGTPLPTDSKGNTWLSLTRRSLSIANHQFFYCLTPIVGTGHTFTLNSVFGYPVIQVFAFSGAGAFRVEAGATATSGTTKACGSVTPNAADSLVVAALCAVSTTATDSISPAGMGTPVSRPFGGGNNVQGSVSVYLNAPASAINPTWSWTPAGSTEIVVAVAVFDPGVSTGTVPNVVGQTEAAATSTLTGAGFIKGTVTTATSPTVAVGLVISQTPTSGSTATLGSAVALVISLGPATGTVPNVVGQTEAAATSTLTGAGFIKGTVTTATSPTVPVGLVISQTPTSGSTATLGSAVALVLSLGPATGTVPNVVGQTEAAATSSLTGAGFIKGTVTTANHATVAAGLVISQTPASGSTATLGSAVALLLSLGPVMGTVPNVVGQTEAAATSTLTAASFIKGTVTTSYHATVAVGLVISQIPASGTSAALGAAVALLTSVGPAPAPPPNLTPATATPIVVSGLPYLAIEDVYNGGGVWTVYFKLTNDTPGDVVVTFWFYGMAIPSDGSVYYTPDYEGYADVGLAVMAFDAYPNCATEVPLKAGESYWIEVHNLWTGVTAPTLHIDITRKPTSTSYPAGQIVIFSASADSFWASKGGLHAGFIDPAAGAIVNFLPFFASTEHGDVLTDGSYLITDNWDVTLPPPPGVRDYYLLRLSPDFAVTSRILFPGPVTGGTFEPRIRVNPATQTFWLIQNGYSGAALKYATVSAAGVLGPLATLTDFVGVSAIVGAHAATQSESHLLLMPQATTVNTIHKWNLTTHAWDGTMGPLVPTYTPTDMLVLADDSIIVVYEKTDHRDVIVRHYDATGTQLHTLSIPSAVNSSAPPRLGYSADPLYCWLWRPLNNGQSLLKKINRTDFSLAVDITVPNVYETSIQTATPALIYVSDSCPVIETRGLAAPTPEPPVSYHLERHPVRRLRRAPHVNNEHQRVFVKKFELDLERGQGLATGQGSDPIVLLRISRDGGQTWGEEIRMQAGALGAYTQRVLARRLGQGRDTVFEVTVSDPIAWSLVGAWLDLEPGTS